MLVNVNSLLQKQGSYMRYRRTWTHMKYRPASQCSCSVQPNLSYARRKKFHSQVQWPSPTTPRQCKYCLGESTNNIDETVAIVLQSRIAKTIVEGDISWGPNIFGVGPITSEPFWSLVLSCAIHNDRRDPRTFRYLQMVKCQKLESQERNGAGTKHILKE